MARECAAAILLERALRRFCFAALILTDGEELRRFCLANLNLMEGEGLQLIVVVVVVIVDERSARP